jgi:histidinol-phosphate aminotransferase
MSGPVAKSTIAQIEPYKAGKAKAAGFDKPIKISANENALGCSPAASEAYRALGGALHVYPDPQANALREALAQKHSLEASQLIFGTGSDEIFSMAAQAYLNPGDEMVQPQFAFAAWAIAARAAGANVISAPERNYIVDVDAMLAALSPRTRMMFVANPASPTGTFIPFADIKRLHAALPENVLLILDGAYAEFAEGRADFEAGFELARNAPNIIVTRTFSKLYGLAALRLGWGYANPTIIQTLNKIRLPFNASSGAQAAAIAALNDKDFSARSLARVDAGRTQLALFLAELGLAPLPAFANFVTVRVPESAPLSAPEIERALAERGILVRGLQNYSMPDCLRITIGTEAEMQSLEQALRAILGA